MLQTFSKRAVYFVCGMTALSSAALADEGGLRLPNVSGDPIILEVSDALAVRDPSNLMQVFVGASDACCEGRTPIAGRYEQDGRRLQFRPAFGFVAGQTYTVLSDPHLTEFTLDGDNAAVPPEVIAIYPSGPDIPENTLRFYVHFSTPMQPHMSAEFVNLVDANGTPDAAAFMHFKQELWNADRTRLTLLMDPGRIKRGVAQNRDLGPALLEGNAYSLVVEGGWPSADGRQNAPQHAQPFTVSAPLRSLPDVDLWQIDAPQIATRDPLTITFDRPFDHHLALTVIRVLADDGTVVSGTVSVTDYERLWTLQPDVPWSGAALTMTVDARLEDVAGNNFRDLLDHAAGVDAQEVAFMTRTFALKPLTE